MGSTLNMLQKWQMNALYSTLAVPIRRSFFAAAILVGSWFLCGEAFAQITPDPQSQPQITKSPQGKQEEAARAAARASAHHFDRVLIIVLEHVDYEVAIQDKNLAALASQGASFSNFHALFHPSYPNYLTMVAGTDFGTHNVALYVAGTQCNFP